MNLPVDQLTVIAEHSHKRVVIKIGYGDVNIVMTSDEALQVAYTIMRAVANIEAKEISCLHKPVVLHRTGGPSASARNYCGKCGKVIRWDDHWLQWVTVK